MFALETMFTDDDDVGIADLWSHPSVLVGTFVLLHVLDFSLTVAGARWYDRGAHLVTPIDGSYELNPLFQRDINKRSLRSRRFLLTLVLIAALLYAFGVRFGSMPGASAMLAGTIVFPRLLIIGRHMQNIAMFRAIALHPQRFKGSLFMDQRVRHGASRIALLTSFVLVLAAVAFGPSAFGVGGLAGLGLLIVMTEAWALRASLAARRR
jgi:hypothetical protein